VQDVYTLAEEYRNNKGFLHELIQEKDYIKTPRDEDGYRSLHLIYKYQNKNVPEYNGLRLELQIRTKKQHAWATAVETMGTFLGQALKSRKGNREWINFFAVTSAAFAHLEKTPLIPRYSHLSAKETFLAVAEAEVNLGAFEMMNAFSAVAYQITEKRLKKWSYHLIELNSLEKTVKITPYDRDSFEQALKDYAGVEAEAAKGKNIEPVLVSAGPLENLRQAYPNFFLDITEFIRIVNQIVTAADGKGRDKRYNRFSPLL
jgi:putative GTP pyrophosphokinase